MRSVPQAAIDLVRDQEETHLFAYDDAFYPARAAIPGDQIQGTLTAGTGHTGSDVSVGMIVSDIMDAAWLLSDLTIAARRLDAQIDGVIDALTDNQYGAMVDFVFNVGAAPSWTIWKRLKAKQFDQVPIELAKFVNTGRPPVKSAGLVRRRNAEIELWSKDEPGTTSAPISSSVTRASVTPPTPSDPVPPRKSKAIIVSAVGAVAGSVPMLDQVRDAITPYAEHSHYVHAALGGLATIAAVCAAVGIGYMYLQKRDARN